jgi:uncharacterized protein (DUF58 family)
MASAAPAVAGAHRLARVRPGRRRGDFRDVHPFTAGDRLRRIDWKATARRGQNAADLYVRRTAALADATVLIVLDSRDDVGEQVAEWNRNTAAAKGSQRTGRSPRSGQLDRAGYIQAGDRVGFQDLSSRSRIIAHAGGRRHLRQLLRSRSPSRPPCPFATSGPRSCHRGARVLLASLLDDKAVQLALRWRVNGHRVIVVDVLPTGPVRAHDSLRARRAPHRDDGARRSDPHPAGARRRDPALARGWYDLPRQARLQLLSRPVRDAATGGRGEASRRGQPHPTCPTPGRGSLASRYGRCS